MEGGGGIFEECHFVERKEKGVAVETKGFLKEKKGKIGGQYAVNVYPNLKARKEKANEEIP